jgi:hypothetical protein
MTDLIEAPSIATVPFDGGYVELDTSTGAPRQFIADADPRRRYLLDSGLRWHSDEHQWGSGHIVTDREAGRWSFPGSLELTRQGSRAMFMPLPGVTLTVTRTGGQRYVESYVFTNVGDESVRLSGIGIQAPFADLYENAESAIERSVHAHLFTGGSWAWALAEPMSGSGPRLGLIVREGALWGYSVESRNQNTLSNARGHIVLHVTDRARNPQAFGGQPEIVLEPSASYTLTWQLGWYDDVAAFLSDTRPPAVFDRVSSPLGEEIRIETREHVSAADLAVSVTRASDDVVLVRADRSGVFTIDVGSARTEIQFHESVAETIRRRVDYIVRHQRTPERAGLLRHAFVPIDTHTMLTQPTNGWQDWTDGSERIGMAVLMQVARNQGTVGDEVDEALAGWSEFARTFLIDDSYAPRRGSHDVLDGGPRLYNVPWLAEFYLERHKFVRPEASASTPELQLAHRLLARAFELGSERFLAIGFSEIVVAVANALEQAGFLRDAGDLRDRLVASARYFIKQGDRLPPHEVAYEQSIVAPLIDLLIDAHTLTGEAEFLDAIQTRLPWLLAFGGPQPHTRLLGVPIRHWDGYWFGIDRQWGDVFPHYWSALTSSVLYRLPDSLRTEQTDALALTILRANMSNYFADGSATCAFVLPTSVDGRPAHSADPLANDQDWHLAIWAKLVAERGAPEA